MSDDPRIQQQREKAIQEIGRLLTSAESDVCLAFGSSDTDADTCRHCGFVEYAHIEKHQMIVVVDQLLATVAAVTAQQQEQKDQGAALLPADPSALVNTETLPNISKDRLRVLVTGALKSYRAAHGDSIADGEFTSAVKRIAGALCTELNGYGNEATAKSMKSESAGEDRSQAATDTAEGTKAHGPQEMVDLWAVRLELARIACQKARAVIGNDVTLKCLPTESDRECLNRCTRDAIAALDAVIRGDYSMIGSGNPVSPSHSDSTRRSEAPNSSLSSREAQPSASVEDVSTLEIAECFGALLRLDHPANHERQIQSFWKAIHRYRDTLIAAVRAADQAEIARWIDRVSSASVKDDQALHDQIRATMQEIAECNLTEVRICPSFMAFGPIAKLVKKQIAAVRAADQTEIAHYKSEGQRLSKQCVTNRAEADRFKAMYMELIDQIGVQRQAWQPIDVERLRAALRWFDERAGLTHGAASIDKVRENEHQYAIHRISLVQAINLIDIYQRDNPPVPHAQPEQER